MKVNWKNEKENLINLISDNVPYQEIGRLYGITGNAVKKAAKRIGIILPKKRKISEKEHFNKGVKRITRFCINCGKEIIKRNGEQKYCSKQCQQEYQYKQKVQEWLANPELFNSEHMYPFIRRYMFTKNNCKCEKCGWGEINKRTNTSPLEVHHIDGDCTNNKEENLQLLCPNCHSLTETFGACNKGSKRYKLKEYKKELSNKRIKKLVYSLEKEEVNKILENVINKK